jgi:ATP-dependent RNA helicase DeaD
LLKALNDVGYETPSPIQAMTIPPLLNGRDVLGQAQTGTGKTAAFALPVLARIDLKLTRPQALVLAPTRELALQVAEAMQRYATHLPGFHILPIYGGQEYNTQIRALKRGVHVVVGTPGRVMDHMRRGTLDLKDLRCLVLDEADEMLRMGFIDDVEWILEQTPPERQIALFSATMPSAVRRIAQKHLHDPQELTIKVRTSTAETIRQRYWLVSAQHKLDALTRILEAETFDGIIVFVRTKTATLELAEKLEARGYSTAALNGDIPQKQRERTVDDLKAGKIDILVATDVAARGLDVERISHVINYDIPSDTEPYVHRIGRTGRAGRSGEAILLVEPRERNMLRTIERATKQTIALMEMPSTETINDIRISRFKQRITDTLAEGDGMELYSQLLEQYQQEHNVPALEIGAALAKMLQGDEPLLLAKELPKMNVDKAPRPGQGQGRERSERSDRGGERHERSGTGGDRFSKDKKPGAKRSRPSDEGMERYRLDVGHNHKVTPGNIVGAIANEAGIDSEFIGRIEIHDDYSTVDLPQDMPRDVFQTLKGVRVVGRPLNLTRLDQNETAPRSKLKLGDKLTPGSKPKFAGKPKPGDKPKFSGKPKFGAKDKPGASGKGKEHRRPKQDR